MCARGRSGHTDGRCRRVVRECYYHRVRIHRGLVIGLAVGVVWTVIGVAGTERCEWNTIESSVIPSGLCEWSMPLFFPPLIGSAILLSAVVPVSVVREWHFSGLLLSAAVEIVLFALVGAIFSLIARFLARRTVRRRV